jgi:hypothetical protein
VRVEAGGIEFGREGFVVGDGDGGGVHDPLADAGDLFAVPCAGGDGVEAPVDEHAEAGGTPPIHAGVALERGFGVLNGRHRMRGVGGDVFAFDLRKGGGNHQKAGESGSKGAAVQVHGESSEWNDDSGIVCEKSMAYLKNVGERNLVEWRWQRVVWGMTVSSLMSACEGVER